LIVESKPLSYDEMRGGQEKALRRLVNQAERVSLMWQWCEDQAQDSVVALRLRYWNDGQVLDSQRFDADVDRRDRLWCEWGWWAEERPSAPHPWTLLAVPA
jgi:hypothetical protein